MTDAPQLCSVIGCPNGKRSKLQHTILYFVPKNPLTAKEWLEALKNHVSETALSKPLICKEHFEPSCFISDSKRLTINAVPSIFPSTFQNSSARPSKKRKKRVHSTTVTKKEVESSKSSSEDGVKDSENDLPPGINKELLKNDPNATLDSSDNEQKTTTSSDRDLVKKEVSSNESEKNKNQDEEEDSWSEDDRELKRKLSILQLLKENLLKELDQIDEEDRVLQKQIHLFKEKLSEEKINMKELPNRDNKLLRKCFSDSQIRTLMGQQKSRWAFDDLAVAYNIVTLTNTEFYMYLRSNLKYPLPAYSNLNRFLKRKEREENDGNSADNEAYDTEVAEENSTDV